MKPYSHKQVTACQCISRKGRDCTIYFPVRLVILRVLLLLLAMEELLTKRLAVYSECSWLPF
jgi:hypothetical protein